MTNPLKSKTVWGAIIVAVAKVVIDHSPESIAQAIGGIVLVWGGRDALQQHADQVAPK